MAALTGVDTDRLPEEQRRGISIDLGFADLALPSGRHAALVDVPGHERFVRNMVAGASGVDLALLVVAADEGVMPQTREHLDILLLLGVARAVVALTKADLVDPPWLAMVAEDVGALLAPTPLAAAPLIPVSALTRQGLPELRLALDAGLAGAEARQDRGFARLPIDRVFSVAGFGTVVTGTLTSGAIAADEHLELLPAGRAVRVRGLQVHGRPVPSVRAGQRVAANLAGLERSEARRGDVLAAPGTLRAGDLLAVALTVLPGAARPLEHGQRFHLHLGTAQTVCRCTLLEADALAPGASAFALLRLQEPLAAGRGDRFILRSLSPMTTVAGGRVLEAGRRFRRHGAAGLQALRLLERGDPAELLLRAFAGPVPLALASAARAAGLPLAEAAPLAQALTADGRLVSLGAAPEAWALATPRWADLRARVCSLLASYHVQYALRPGMPREALRGAALAGAETRAAAAVLARLAEEGVLRAEGEHVALPGHVPQLPPGLAAAADHLVAGLEAAGLQPPALAEALAAAGLPGGPPEHRELLAFLTAAGRIVAATDGLYFGSAAAAQAAERVRAHLRAHGSLTVGQLRDLLGVSRKYAVPLAEYLDEVRVTRREGDVRRLG